MRGYPFSPPIEQRNVSSPVNIANLQGAGSAMILRSPILMSRSGVRQPQLAPHLGSHGAPEPQSAPHLGSHGTQFSVQPSQWEQWQHLQEQRYQEQKEFMRKQQEQMMMFQQRTFELIQSDN